MSAGERASCHHGVFTHQQPIDTEARLILLVGSTMDYSYGSDYSPDDHTRNSAHTPVQGAPDAFDQEA
jgi:hypothetical protein